MTHHQLRMVSQEPAMPQEPVNPVPFYLKFQRELTASEQVTSVLAPFLQHVHWLYEGWDDTTLAHPLNGDLLRLYSEAASYMVRFCSTPERKCAESRAKRWAVMELARFLKGISDAPDTDTMEARVMDFAQTILDIHRHALMHGVDVLTPQENILKFELEANDDPRRI